MRRLIPVALVAAATLVLASCSFGEPPEPEAGEPPNLPTPSPGPPEEPASFLDVVAAELEVPWGMGFLPDGTAIIGERDSGRILSIGLSEDGTAAEPEEAYVVEGIESAGDGGLLGLAVSPDFAEDSTVYAYYTTAEDNRIAAIDLSGEGEPEPILTGIPSGSSANGGALAFGPEGDLWAATGDAGDPQHSQDPDSLGGKILSITTDGEPADGNPDPDSPVYSSGHHNIQGLAWNPDGELYATEFGADLADEVNRIEAGGNYGWPQYEGPGGDEEYIDPIASWEPFEASCSGATFVEQTLVTACLRGQRLWVIEFDSNGEVAGEPQPSLESEFGRLRSVAMGPDGMLWVTTSNRDGECVAERGCTADETDDRVLRFATAYAAEGRVLCRDRALRRSGRPGAGPGAVLGLCGNALAARHDGRAPPPARGASAPPPRSSSSAPPPRPAA